MAANKVLLTTRPDHDLINKYFSVWSVSLNELARKKGMTVCDLFGKKAVRNAFDSYVKKNKPSLVFLNGHGAPQFIEGYDGEIIVDADSVIPKAIIYARSCDAGEGVGPSLVKNGARTFIGYKRKFMLAYTPVSMTRPLDDRMASLFLEPSNLVVSTLLKDHTAIEADKRSRDAMVKNFRKMICSTASFEERYAARWMWGNLTHQVLCGDHGASLVK